jgi:hypothetical protein
MAPQSFEVRKALKAIAAIEYRMRVFSVMVKLDN